MGVLGPERICCVATSPRQLDGLEGRPCGLVEVRLDYTGVEEGLRLVEELAGRGYRVVATLRSVEEGGRYEGPPERKVDVLLEALGRGAAFVDVEYRFPLLGDLLGESGDRVIVSVHFFDWTPQPELLYAIAGSIVREGAAVAKIAALARSMSDNHSLLGVNARWPGRVVAIGMGRMGLYSRILAPVYGAPFTYASLGEKTAPGQPQPEHVIEAWRLLGLA